MPDYDDDVCKTEVRLVVVAHTATQSSRGLHDGTSLGFGTLSTSATERQHLDSCTYACSLFHCCLPDNNAVSLITAGRCSGSHWRS